MNSIEREIDNIGHGQTRIVDNRFKVSFWAEVYDLSTENQLIGMNLTREQLMREINERR